MSSIEVDAFLEAECFKINFLEAICYKIKNKKSYNRGGGETGVSSIEANALLKAVCQRCPPLVLPCLQVSCTFVLGLVRLHCRCATKQLTHYTTPLKNTSSQSSRKVSFSLDGVRCMAFWRPLAARPKTRVCVCAKERERALIGFIVVIYYCECLL